MNSGVFSMPVHPAAEIFPMLSPDELADLAADIKANGQAMPIIVKDGVLIDGRNRREACKMAGVEPKTTELNGADPVAYIVSTNINRRHMTKGQRAMAVAKVYPDAEKGGRGKTAVTANTLVSGGFSRQRLDIARAVIRWAPEFADAVLAGAESLDRAYEIAANRKLKAEVPEKRLQVLQRTDPDLAVKVVEGQLTLDDAEGANKARRDRERVSRQGLYDCMAEIDKMMVMFRDGPNLEHLVAACRDHADEPAAAKVPASIAGWIQLLTTAARALR